MQFFSNNDYVIKLKNVSVNHNDIFVLQDINFTIHKGEFYYLIGKTGSGKSTLLKTLYADMPLKNGEGIVAGFDLNNLEYSEVPFLRRRLGIIFQDFQLLTDRNVEENLLFVLRATGWKDKNLISEKIDKVLSQVGMQWSLKKMPHQLSGGEQQRVVIARSLLNDPLILLADEPTGNLDPNVAEEVLSLFLDINKGGMAVLMATHNHLLVEKYPNKILKCKNGRICCG